MCTPSGSYHPILTTDYILMAMLGRRVKLIIMRVENIIIYLRRTTLKFEKHFISELTSRNSIALITPPPHPTQQSDQRNQRTDSLLVIVSEQTSPRSRLHQQQPQQHHRGPGQQYHHIQHQKHGASIVLSPPCPCYHRGPRRGRTFFVADVCISS